MYLERDKLKNHTRIWEEVVRSEVRREGRHYSSKDCDAMYFKHSNLLKFLRSKLPLHFLLDKPYLDIELSMIISRIKTPKEVIGGVAGKNSKGTDGHKVFPLCSDYQESGSFFLKSRPITEKDNMHSKFSTDATKPNNIQNFLNTMEYGGSTQMSYDTIRHLITNRVANVDSMSFFCINLYMYLQKCIMYYSCKDLKCLGEQHTIEVERLVPATLYESVASYDILIDVDNMTDLEIEIMSIGLLGHQSIILQDAEQPRRHDIFSRIFTGESKFKYCTRTLDTRVIKYTSTVIGPELALETIYSICSKLGIIRDWLATPDICSGLATFLDLSNKVHNLDGREIEFTIDKTQDRHYGTLFPGLCNHETNDTADHTNLGASSVNLVMEVTNGQLYMNNLHYLCESIGILNKKIFSTDVNKAKIYTSYMNEMGLFKRDSGERVSSAIFSQMEAGGLQGNVKFFMKLISEYVSILHRNHSQQLDDIMWLQLNCIGGRVFSNNSSSRVGEARVISSGELGPLVNNLHNADLLSEWLMMHQLTDKRTMAGGMSHIAEAPLYQQDPSIFKNCKSLYGIYKCTWAELTILGNCPPRVGYDSLTYSSAYYTLSYFCTGDNKESSDPGNPGGRVYYAETSTPGMGNNEISQVKEDKAKVMRSKDIDANPPAMKKGSQRLIPAVERKTARTSLRDEVEFDIAKSTSIKSAKSKAMANQRNNRIEDPLVSFDNLGDLSQMLTGTSKMSGVVEQKELTNENDDEYRLNESEIIGDGAGGSIKRFSLRDVPGDGNCLAHVLTEFHNMNKTLRTASRKSKEIAWEPDNQWLSSETAMAFNQMLGVDTVVYDARAKGATIAHVNSDNNDTCYIYGDDTHYQLLVEDENGDIEIDTDTLVQTNLLVGTMQSAVAEAYATFLNSQGIQSTSIVDDNFPNSRRIVVDTQSGSFLTAETPKKNSDSITKGDKPLTYRGAT
jgi:hypothetical protein